MSNVKSIIPSHNTRIVNQPQEISTENCNCGNKHSCPLQNKCMSKDIDSVYKATLIEATHRTQSTTLAWLQTHLKSDHIKSFTQKLKKYSNETELSKHVWQLKQNKTP